MASFNLSFTACSFHLKKSYTHQSRAFDLNNAFPITRAEQTRSIDIFNLFSMFVEAHSAADVDPIRKRMYSCSHDPHWEGETPYFRYWYMKIVSGEYGSSSDLVNVTTGENTYSRGANEAEMKPFIVFIVIPKRNENVSCIQKGMLFFQNVGPYGIKTVTTNKMSEQFSNLDITLTCKTISSALFFSRVVRQDTLLTISCFRNATSTDRADRLGFGYGREVRVFDKLLISNSKWQHLLECFRSFSGDRRQLFEFEGIGRGYDNVKLTVDIGGRNRVIDLHNMENLSIVEAIPDEIRGDNGHPVLDRLIPFFIQTAEEYLSQMVLQF